LGFASCVKNVFLAFFPNKNVLFRGYIDLLSHTFFFGFSIPALRVFGQKPKDILKKMHKRKRTTTATPPLTPEQPATPATSLTEAPPLAAATNQIPTRCTTSTDINTVLDHPGYEDAVGRVNDVVDYFRTRDFYLQLCKSSHLPSLYIVRMIG
jgi:hypothetical protein